MKHILTILLILVATGAWGQTKTIALIATEDSSYKERFFIVFYTANHGEKMGNMSFSYYGFMNYKAVMKEIEVGEDIQDGTAILTGIVEITAEDFKSYND